jgi:protocatechuate 3,4-dioxygenase beta subunit
MNQTFSRRQTICGMLIGTTTLNLFSGTATADEPGKPVAEPLGQCTLFPQAVEGPYYLDHSLIRSDIREDRPGLKVDMKLTVADAETCKPLSGARVDIWHADASGVYSGYDHQGDDRTISTIKESYLRGTQISDVGGRVLFRTIYPGWYPGRTPHIHVKVFLDQLSVVTGQIYFPTSLSGRIYRDRAPYNLRPHPDTDNASDFIFKSGEREGGGIVFTVDETPDKLIASLLISVDRSGKAARRATGWGSYFRQIIGL